MDFNDFVSHTGQVVTCDINYGLKCRKEDQVKPPKKCFNYKIKVCCPVVTCETTTAITTTQEPTTTTTFTSTEPPTTTQEPTTTTTFTTTEAPTTTQEPTTTTTVTTPTEPPTTTQEPTTTTTFTTTEPPTTTQEPTTTTTFTTTEPPTTTQEPTTTKFTTPTKPPTTTQEPTTTKFTTPTEPPTTTQEPTTTTTFTSTEPPTTTQEPTTTKFTTPTKPPTTTQEPTTTKFTTPTKPPTTTQEPTTTTTFTTAEPPTTTQEPTTTTTVTTPTEPPTTTQEPTTTTTFTTTEAPTTTQEPTTTTTVTTPTEPPTTTQEPTTTTTFTTPTEPPTTTQEPTTTTIFTSTEHPTTTQEPTTTTFTTPTKPPTTTQEPTTTTTFTTTEPPTTTQEPTTTTIFTSTERPTTTQEPTTTTFTTPTEPPTTTQEPTTTTTFTTTEPPTTTQEPTTTTIFTTTERPTTTQEPTTTTFTTPTEPPTTTQEPTTTTTFTTTEPPTTTQEPTTTTIFTSTERPTTTQEPTTTTFITPTEPPTTTQEPTTTKFTTPTEPPTTTQEPTTTKFTTPTKPPTTTQEPTTTTTFTTPTTIGCPDWGVEQSETFYLCNCTMAKCIENNTVEILPYECPPIENITCTNGKKPVEVYDEYHCCKHYACDCVCEGWGDPHYNTFDGLYYSYQGNCTYVLMEEISPRHNLRIYIDNVFCDLTEDVSCPRSIIVEYGLEAVRLINHNFNGGIELEVLKDGESLKLPFSQHGVKILNSGINLVLEIPRLKVIITFGLTGFSVNLPYQYFGSNTQGHCGTCTNNQADDCRLPGGQLVESCAVMADYWPAKVIDQPNCQIPSVLPTSVPEPPPTLTPCNADSICDLLRSSVFEGCHPFVSPENFYKGCVFDSCHVSNPTVECTSLQIYAAACAQAGVCLHWRNYTKHCASNCPSNKIYKPCGPVEQPTCEDNSNEPSMNFTTEGCFCPDGMKLFNQESGKCVDKCGCLDPEGIPREFNERFEYKCQNCICEESTKTVTCKPKECPTPSLTHCTSPGFVLVNQTNPSDHCCYTYVCQCQSTTCPVSNMNCPVGYMPDVTVPEGKCCPEHTCEPKKVCVHKDTEYQPGSIVPVAVHCQDCTCGNEVDPNSGLFKISCEFQQCQQNCDSGFQYVQTDSDECCGKCVQTHCVFNINGTKQLLMQGQTWSPPENKCQHYTCSKINGTLETYSSRIVCPSFEQSICHPGTIETTANGCCKTCVEKDKACKLRSEKVKVLHKNCLSYLELDMPYCEGSCNTFTKYSEKAAAMQQSCSCCKQARFSNRTVDLHCLNGDVVPYTYIHVEECGCAHTDCMAAAEQPARRRRSFKPV
ncbi:intestinal mucin-like protein [Pempheris klunzingeri]|uniref:intestinal mucin-like protein n=1 Tax=Pempheris klunzingeri TaxID=3127111 RepID=UPI0039804846